MCHERCLKWGFWAPEWRWWSLRMGRIYGCGAHNATSFVLVRVEVWGWFFLSLLIDMRAWGHCFNRRESLVSGLYLWHMFIFVFSRLAAIRRVVRPFLCVARMMCMRKNMVSTHFFTKVISIVTHNVDGCRNLHRAKGGEDEHCWRAGQHDCQGDNLVN